MWRRIVETNDEHSQRRRVAQSGHFLQTQTCEDVGTAEPPRHCATGCVATSVRDDQAVRQSSSVAHSSGKPSDLTDKAGVAGKVWTKATSR